MKVTLGGNYRFEKKIRISRFAAKVITDYKLDFKQRLLPPK
jgi:hypothetical protein